MADDPLEALRDMEARWLACKDHQILTAALAALEKERERRNAYTGPCDVKVSK